MKNVIFISPNFPVNYWQFCHELRCDGVNVLGIGDQPYDELRFELKSSLTEYYKVSSLEDYDQVYRAVAFFIFKYGRIDFLESNNEYWLEQDAHLRSDFNIAGGFRVTDLAMDLSIIAAVLSSNVDTPIEAGWCMAGEVGLSGEVRPVARIEQRIAEAEKLGFSHIIVPKYNLQGLDTKRFHIHLVPVRKVEEALRALFG